MSKQTKIIAVVNQKGGAGKTTVVMLAAGEAARRGRNVMVIDGDRQSSSFRWKAKRTEKNIYPPFPAPVIEMGFADVKSRTPYKDPLEFIQRISDAASSALDYVIIDTPPSVSEPAVLGALAIADLVIIPMPADMQHVDAFLEVQETIIQANELRKSRGLAPLKARVLVNKLKAHIASENLIASQMTKLIKRDVFKTMLKQRTVYPSSYNNRTTHYQTAGKKKEANDEIASLVNEIEELIDVKN